MLLKKLGYKKIKTTLDRRYWSKQSALDVDKSNTMIDKIVTPERMNEILKILEHNFQASVFAFTRYNYFNYKIPCYWKSLVAKSLRRL